MRAARAVKEFQEAQGDLAAHLEDVVNLESNGNSLDYILQSLLPLLKRVFSELCTKKPENPSAFLAIWLLEQCHAPSSTIADLHQWMQKGENIANPSKTDLNRRSKATFNDEDTTDTTDAAKEDLEVKPPSSKPPDDNPRKLTHQASALSKSSRLDRRPSEVSSPGLPQSALRRKSRFETDNQGDETDNVKDGEQPTLKSEPSEKRRLSFWSMPRQESCEGADSDSDGDNDDNTVEGAQEALLALRGHAPGSEGQGHRRGSQKFGDRRRRFTIALTSSDLMPPPMEEVKELLRSVAMFKNFKDDELAMLSRTVRCRKYEQDEAIVDFGGKCEDLHVVVDGCAKVSVPQQIGSVKRGDFFGDQSLRVEGAVHSTQVVALGAPVTTISISATDYKELPMHHYLLSNTHGKTARVARNVGEDAIDRPAVAGGGLCEASGLRIIQDYSRTVEDKELIVNALTSNKVLGEVLTLSDEQIGLLADAMHVVSLPAHDTLMKKGDRGTALFIVLEGLLNVTHDDTLAGEFKIRVGDSFGELSLLYDAPRTATMVAARDCKLFVLPRYEFRIVIRMSYSQRLAEYSRLILKVPCLSSMVDSSNVDLIAGALEEVSFLQNEEVCNEDQDAGLLFIVWEGKCDVLKDGKVISQLNQGEWIGEEQLVRNIKATNTVRVTTESAVILALDSNSLRAVSKAMSDMKRAQAASPSSQSPSNALSHGLTIPGAPNKRSQRSSVRSSLVGIAGEDVIAIANIDHQEKQKVVDEFFHKRMSRVEGVRKQKLGSGGKKGARQSVCGQDIPPLPESLDISSLKQVGLLGEGSFGSVYLLQHSESEVYFAFKGLCKKHIREEKMEQVVQNERSTMSLLDSDFIVRLFKSYQDSGHIYLMLEAALGGELFDVYTRSDLFGKIDHARFYAACVTLGLSHMHLKRVIYRDLKLENCLLDNRGYLKLTDMGIAKAVIGKTYTVCGTADYFAPETLRQVGHNRAVDWWALGVLLFIMLAGRSPFDAPEVSLIYKNIIKGFSKVKFPPSFPSDVVDTIKSLCRKLPEERVTMQKGGVDNLKEMPFFSSLSWEQLASMQLEPPFKPELASLDEIRKRKADRPFSVDLAKVEEWDGGIGHAEGLPSDIPKHNDDEDHQEGSFDKKPF
jgi:cGMP-dependent protein kinase